MFYFSALHRGALCQRRKAREIAPSLPLSLTHYRALLFIFSVVNNAFSLHAYSSSTVCWKHFMKIRSCLKLKLISNLNLLAFYFSPSPFPHSLWYSGHVHRADWIYINFLSVFFFFETYFHEMHWHYWISGGCNHSTLMSFGEDCWTRETKKRWLIDLDICFAF